MCLYFALMYKTLGGYNWSDLFNPAIQNGTVVDVLQPAPIDNSFDSFDEPLSSGLNDENIMATASDMKSSIQDLKAVMFISLWLILRQRSTELTFECFWFADIHNGSVSRSVWLCHVVDMFHMVCRIVIRNDLPIVFHQSVDLICNLFFALLICCLLHHHPAPVARC